MISSGYDGTRFWDSNNYNNINLIDLLYDEIMKVISINEKRIINKIFNQFYCWGIKLIENKRIIFVGGWSKDIKIYRKDNFECIQIINMFIIEIYMILLN